MLSVIAVSRMLLPCTGSRPMRSRISGHSTPTRDASNMFSNIATALKLYRLDNFGYPTTEQGLAALVEKPTMDPIPRNWKQSGYLPELPMDPWGRPYLYLNPAELGGGEYDLYSLGADGVTGGEGQNADLGNWQTEAEGQQ